MMLYWNWKEMKLERKKGDGRSGYDEWGCLVLNPSRPCRWGQLGSLEF